MTDIPQDEPPQDAPPRRPMRLETRIPNNVAETTYWNDEAVRSLVGQQPRLTLGGDPRRGAAKVLVVAARRDGDDVLVTVEVPDPPEGSDLAAALANVQAPDGSYSLGAVYQAPRVTPGAPTAALPVRLHELYPFPGNPARDAVDATPTEPVEVGPYDSPPPRPLPHGYVRLPGTAWRDGVRTDTVIEVAQVCRWEPTQGGEGTRIMLTGGPGGPIVSQMSEAEFAAWFTEQLAIVRGDSRPGSWPHPTVDAFAPRRSRS